MHMDAPTPLLVSLARAGSIKCMKPRRHKLRWLWIVLRSSRNWWWK